MQKATSTLSKVLICFLVLFTFSCEEDYEVITSSKFETLLKAKIVDQVIVISDKGMVEIYLNAQKLAESPYNGQFESGEVLAIKKIEQEYFVEQYDSFRKENKLRDAPNLSFNSRPNFMDFLVSYGFPFILLLMMLAVFIVFPVIIFSQKKKIKNLQAQVRMLHDQNSSSDQK